MKHPLKIAALSLAAIGLITIGIWSATAARAETATPAADTQVTADSISATAVTAAPSTTITEPSVDRHQERLTEMAALLGITTDQLQTELNSGKEFYQIATVHGVTYDQLVANRDAEYKARLDDMVKVGFLTPDEATTMYQQFQTQAQQMPMFGMGFGHHGHGFGM
ncbi:MAG: hypothetical protein V1916_01865 [Patescibacteria group bacterium]